jgi:uncharacterized protein (TIGR02996 family)
MTHDAFLRAILDTPDDDAPRLVYADWLEERGEALGPFIRVQLRLAAMAEEGPARWPLEAEQARLEAELRPAATAKPRAPWAAGVPAWALRDRWGFRRGLIGWLSTTAKNYAGGAEVLHATAPVQELHLRSAVRYLGELFGREELRHVRKLSLVGNKLSATGARALCESPHVRGVRELDLRDTRLRIAEASQLGNTSALPALERLRISWNQLHDAGPEALLAGRLRERVKELDLARAQMGPRGAAAVARCASLERLSLVDNRIGDEGARRLTTAGLGKLTHLDVAANRIGTEALAGLLTADGLPALTHLNISGNPADAGLYALTPAARLHGRLRLALPTINDLPHEALAGSPLVAACAGLELPSWGFWLEHVEALAASPSASGLRSLTVVGHAVRRASLEALAGSPHLARLEELRLQVYTWEDELIEGLLVGGLVRRLKHLSVRAGYTTGPAEGLHRRAGELAHLERMTVSANLLLEGDAGALREALGWRLRVE